MKKTIVIIFILLFALPTHASQSLIEEVRGTSTIASLFYSSTSTESTSTKKEIIPYIKVNKRKIIDYVEKDNNIKYAYYDKKSIIKEIFYNKKFIKESISLRKKNLRTFKLGENLYRTDFYSKNKFIKNANGYWYDVKTATSTKEVFDKHIKFSFFDKFIGLNVFATTSDFYSSSGDGRCRNTDFNWINGRTDISSDTSSSGEGSLYAGVGIDSYGDYLWNRTFIPIYTYIGDVNIVSSTLNLFIEDKWNDDNDGNDFISVFETSQATTSDVANSDYDEFVNNIDDLIELIDVSERKDITNISVSNWLEIDLNQNGLDIINKTGWTKLGILGGNDILNHVFVGSNNDHNSVRFASSEDIQENYLFLSITYIATITPMAVLDLETGNINQSVTYKEIYDEVGVLTGYEYEINHNPFITYSVYIFTSLIFFLALFLMIRRGFSKKNKIMN